MVTRQMLGAEELVTVRGRYFDTLNVISCVAPHALLEEALERCAFFEKLLSRFIEDSDVWRINHAGGMLVEVSEHTLNILRCAEELRSVSEGAFNIAIGTAASLWGFAAVSPQLPAANELKAAARRLAAVRVEVEGSAVAVRSGEPGGCDAGAGAVAGVGVGAGAGVDAGVDAGAWIDLGGIAKGYICDQVAEFLRERGVTSGLLNFGGNVVAIGAHPEGRPWSVALQYPDAQRDAAGFAVVKCENSAIVTSGVYERGFYWKGKRYHHILDPRSCWPVDNGLLSVTVLVDDGMLADALATTVLVLGIEKGFALANRYQAKLVLLDSEHRVYYSKDTALELLSTTQHLTVATGLE